MKRTRPFALRYIMATLILYPDHINKDFHV